MLDPPNGGYMMSGSPFLLIGSGALILVMVFAILAGYFQINKKTRKSTSMISYIACLLSFYLCIILYYNVFFTDVWREASYYSSFYNIFYMLMVTALFPILLLLLIILNRFFIIIGTRLSTATIG